MGHQVHFYFSGENKKQKTKNKIKYRWVALVERVGPRKKNVLCLEKKSQRLGYWVMERRKKGIMRRHLKEWVERVQSMHSTIHEIQCIA